MLQMQSFIYLHGFDKAKIRKVASSLQLYTLLTALLELAECCYL